MNLSVESVALLILIAALVAMVARRLRLPYTVGLVITGVGLAFFPHHPRIELSKELIFTAFLPPLIFEASLHIRWHELRATLVPVTVLATLGVGISAAITAAGMQFVTSWPWSSAY
jgi:CPA1 family monovalent cation:H+ antiporter